MSAPAREQTTQDSAPTFGGVGDNHYIHPTDPARMWCGSPRRPGPIVDPKPRVKEKPVCVVCLDLRAMYGIDGWLALRDGAA